MAGLYRGKVQDGCEINYMQSKKYPNSSEKVYPNNNVSNKGLLKNPYNTINEPIAKPGQRPTRITTDMWGNVYARSDTMLIPNVTNSTLLKNPFNNLSEPVPEKKVLSQQKIKDINNKNIPEFMRKNVGVTDLAMKMLMMIRNKNVKLFTVRLMSYLVTKNLNDIQIDLGVRGEQQILQAVNIYNQLMANAKRINIEYGGNEEQLTTNLYPYVHSYVEQLIRAIPALGAAELRDIDERITKALADLAAVSSALNRLFDQDKAMEPAQILSAVDIVRLGGIQAASVPPVSIPSSGVSSGGGSIGPTGTQFLVGRNPITPPKDHAKRMVYWNWLLDCMPPDMRSQYLRIRTFNLTDSFLKSRYTYLKRNKLLKPLPAELQIDGLSFSKSNSSSALLDAPTLGDNPSSSSTDPLQARLDGVKQTPNPSPSPAPQSGAESELGSEDEGKEASFLKFMRDVENDRDYANINVVIDDIFWNEIDTMFGSFITYIRLMEAQEDIDKSKIPSIATKIEEINDFMTNVMVRGSLITRIKIYEKLKSLMDFFFQSPPQVPKIAQQEPSAGRKKKQGGKGLKVKLLNQSKAGKYQSY